jgi:outer membrane protein assembly complex protein YaeT
MMPASPFQKSRRRLVFATFAALTLSLLAEDHVVKDTSVPVKTRGVGESMLSSVDELITQQLDLSADTVASTALADDLAFFVRRHYLTQGYDKVKTSWLLEGMTVVVAVDEGLQGRVGEVTFDGNPGLDVKELRRYLLRPTRDRVGRFVRETPYVEKEVREGLDLVHRYLLSQGYQDATVDDPLPTVSDDGSVAVHVALHPGVQWHVGAVTLTEAPEKLTKEMLSSAQGLHDQVANEARMEATRRQLEGVMQAHGYFEAKVTMESTRGEDSDIDIAFTAVPGALHRVSELQIDEKFSKGARRLVASAFRPALDHTFDSMRMEMAYGRVTDTGIFEHLEMEPKEVAEDALALLFSGKEAKRSSVGVQGGYDTFLGPILGVEYKNRNVFDSGGLFGVKVLGTALGLQAGVQWKNPAIFNSPYALSIEIKPETFTFDGYDRHTLALRGALSRDFTRHFSGEIYIGASVNEMSSATLTSLELGPESYSVGNAGLTLRYEARDNPVSPTKGWFASATVEAGDVTGGAQDVSYLRTDLAMAYYRPITNKWRTAIGLHIASLISGSDVGSIPIELRNYNGGAKGVRSFAERELGPKAHDGTPLGGTQSDTLSGEISYELVKNLEIAGFVDAGSLSTDKGTVLPKLDDVRYAAGVGLRYRLPFGPLRVDYGVNLDRRAGEATGALHIGFGFAF